MRDKQANIAPAGGRNHQGNGSRMAAGRWIKCLPVLMLAAVLLAAGCSNANNGGGAIVEGKVNVVTSFYPLYDFATKIGGEHVHAVNLVPTGVEPHDWTPKAQDMKNIVDADLFIYNGADFEGWVHDFLDTLKSGEGPAVIVAARGVPLIETAEHDHDDHEGEAHEDHDHDDHEGEAHEDHDHDDHEDEAHEEHAHEEDDHGHNHSHGDYDPHIWLSPKQAMIIAANIRQALIDADPAHEQDYTANYDKLIGQLQELDAELTRIAGSGAKKEFVVSHESFGYVARDYGLVQMGVMGLSPDAEPTVKRMQEIKAFAEEHQIKYILFEELVSSKLAETLASSLNIETMVLNPLEGLTEEQQKAGADYFSIMKSNLTTLEKALQ